MMKSTDNVKIAYLRSRAYYKALCLTYSRFIVDVLNDNYTFPSIVR